MILGFKTQINGKPTHFVEKIWEGIFKGIKINYQGLEIGKKALPENYIINTHKPKIHTIREDKNNRWKAGLIVDFFINVRTKDMFRFAPQIPVVSVQSIKIVYITDAPYVYNAPEIQIDGKVLPERKWLEFAQADGFETTEDFFSYFNKDFTGKIIHWTDKKY